MQIVYMIIIYNAFSFLCYNVRLLLLIYMACCDLRTGDLLLLLLFQPERGGAEWIKDVISYGSCCGTSASECE